MTLARARATIRVKEDILDHIDYSIRYEKDRVSAYEERTILNDYEAKNLAECKERIAVLEELKEQFSEF